MKAKHLILSLMIAIMTVVGGCNNAPRQFKLQFIMETMNNYRTTLELDERGGYVITSQNFFMDRHAGKAAPETNFGELTQAETDRLKSLMQRCNLMKMDDAYGFETDANPVTENIIYQIIYNADGKEKMITIRYNPDIKLPVTYVALHEFFIDCLKKYS